MPALPTFIGEVIVVSALMAAVWAHARRYAGEIEIAEPWILLWCWWEISRRHGRMMGDSAMLPPSFLASL